MACTLLTGHDRVIESWGINDLHALEVLQGIVQRDGLGDSDILPISTDIVDEIGEAVFLCLPQKAIELGNFPSLGDQLLSRLDLRTLSGRLLSFLYGKLCRITQLCPFIWGIELRHELLLWPVGDIGERSGHRTGRCRQDSISEDEGVEEG